MKNLLIVLFLSFPLFATDLVLKDGYVAAHTKMLMDSTINPTNNSLKAKLTIQNSDITTLAGKFWVEMALFTSDKSDRDESMYEDLEIGKFKLATYTISKITKTSQEDNYIIDGTLDFHGIQKALSAKADIKITDDNLNINAISEILVSDFGIEMPCLMFMCVRDKVELIIKASLQ